MGWYPPSDGPRFVAALQYDTNAYKDFFESEDKKEVLKIARETCEREVRKVIVFERGEGVIERFNPPAIDDPPTTEPEPTKGRAKKIKRK